ncbi:GroES-like protein [Lepidopterella palustris CBS 459.81]|uniref:GroES-like protein n=1 Tax=Lepidopterella palustris CBS 459.81 TaxID=1314670 RepID=A0A8E2JI51_9PEZI|nr:GroES-like protein [Lepidopterella palustris CBS 459.81]
MPSFTVYKGSKDGSIQKSSTSKPELTADQVLLRITASGLCGTDAHYRTQDMALGHEGAGVVEAVGPSVRYLKAGDRVGWGYEHDCCGACQWCLSGRETYCPERAIYGLANLDQGSFATHAVWREAFLFRIPDELSDEEAAPLMCGGATVFNALHMYDIQPTARVGVIGVGGLGHLAIQFAAKMGCDVVVFSGTNSKKEEAMKLGAKEFFATKGKTELDIGKKVDALLVTTSMKPDWNLYFPLMAPDSVIFPISVAEGNLELPYMPLLLNGIRIQGSFVAPRLNHRQMLDFAARHGIKPILMKFPMTTEGITEAMQTLKDGRMRYRGVLVPETKA